MTRPTLVRRALRATVAATAVAALIGVPVAAASADATALPTGVTRAGGANRIDTAVQVSRQLWGKGAATSGVLSTSAIYADAIGGARLASAAHGPLLLTGPGSLAAPVANEIQRAVAPGGTVYLLGQTGALSDSVKAAVEALPGGYTAVRLGGTNRYETAVDVADEVDRIAGDTGPVYLATGVNFPDGLSVAPLAAHTGGVVVLTDGDHMPAATAAYLAAHDAGNTRSVPVGGPAAVARPSAGRAIVGSNRYDTAVRIAGKFTSEDGRPAATTVGLAVGSDWPDALVGASGMGALGGPLLLHTGAGLSTANSNAVNVLLERNPTVHSGLIVGGLAVVPQQAQDDLAFLVN